MKVKIGVRSIEGIAPADKDTLVWDTELPGFGLKVTPKGKRSFVLFYRSQDGTQRKPTIGSYPAMRPEQARRIAQDWLAEVRAGGDPSRTRQEQRANRGRDTIAELFEDYCREKADMKSLNEVRRIFTNDIIPALGKRRAEDVTRAEVNRLLDKVASRSRSVALRLRQALSAFYNWALPRLPDGVSNPVTNAIRIAPPKARDRVLSDVELKGLWQVLEQEKEPWRTALRLLILTGQRRNEVFDADWSEFDLTQKTWTIPAARAKNGKQHLVPLSNEVVTLISTLTRHGPLLRPPDYKTFQELTQRSPREVQGARWTEVDLAEAVWRLSKRRSDTGVPTDVHLSSDALDFLQSKVATGPLFPGGGRAFSRAASRIRTALDVHLRAPAPAWSWHDIRRSVATGLQRLGTRLEVTEAILNHVSGSRAGIVGVYQRHDWLDEKRAALTAWAANIVGPPHTLKVVQLRA